jgi:hypothetical protein
LRRLSPRDGAIRAELIEAATRQNQATPLLRLELPQ